MMNVYMNMTVAIPLAVITYPRLLFPASIRKENKKIYGVHYLVINSLIILLFFSMPR